MLRLVADFGLRDAPWGFLAKNAVLPLLLFMGGVFLVFGRRLAALCFAAYLIVYIVRLHGSEAFSVPSVVMAVLFLVYALWLWKAGHLHGWPGSRSRLAPIDGSE